MRSRYSPDSRSAFTLIELLVVITIIAILAVVVVLTLNPAQLLAQARDANRISDMATINGVITLYQADQQGASIGIASTTYISIPDSSSVCANTGLPPLSGGYGYLCASSASLKNTNGSGWVPINFSTISGGSPIGVLPMDPVNQSSSDLYYTYTVNNATYELTASLESNKYLKQYLLQTNPDPGRYAIGTSPGLVALSEGLVGYWSLDEGSGSLANDISGNGNSGTWTGTPVGTGGTYYSPGKVGSWAGAFDGASTRMTIPASASLSPTNAITIGLWFNTSTTSTSTWEMLYAAGGNIYYGFRFGQLQINFGSVGAALSYPAPSLGVWNQAVATYNGSAINLYLNGVLVNTEAASGTLSAYASSNGIGYYPYSNNDYFPGLIDDARVYNRALSSAEISALYKAEK